MRIPPYKLLRLISKEKRVGRPRLSAALLPPFPSLLFSLALAAMVYSNKHCIQLAVTTEESS